LRASENTRFWGPAWAFKACESTSSGSPPSTVFVRIRQHTAYVSIAYVSIRQHTSAYVSIRPHTSAHVSIRQNTAAYVSKVSTRALSPLV
jgi:hypothetical protein